MAFVMRIEDIDGVVMFDFLDSAFLEAVSTEQRVTSDGDGNLIEDMLIISRNSGSSAARSGARTLSDIAEKVARWFEIKTESRSIWWVMNTEGETEKRALIKSMTIDYENINDNPSSYLTQNRGAYRVVITHSELFEEKTVTDMIGAPSVLAVPESGGKVALTTQILNTNTDSRIPKFSVGSFFIVNRPISVFWAGILPFSDAGINSRDSFDPVLDSSKTNLALTDTSVVVDPTSGGHGNVFSTDFSTDKTLTQRVEFVVDVDQHEGTYHAMLLSYVDSTAATKGKIGVRASVSTSGTATTPNISRTITDTIYIPAPRITSIDGYDKWRFNDLGVIHLPSGAYRNQDAGIFQQFHFTIWASQPTGTSKMYIANVVLIPSTHFISAHTPVENTIDESGIVNITYEDGELATHITRSTALAPILDSILPSHENWVYPKEGGVLVMCGGDDRDGDGRSSLELEAFDFDVYKTNKLYAEDTP